MNELGTQSGNLPPHRGVLILVFGILSFFVCVIFGVVAWVMANQDLAAMKAGQMDPTGESMTTVGKILGIISVCLNLISLVFFILIMLGMFTLQATN